MKTSTANTSKTTFIGRDLVSLFGICSMKIAKSCTRVSPAAGRGVSQGRMPVTMGRISPNPPSSSAVPIKRPKFCGWRLAQGETRYLATEVAGGFTGVYFGLYDTANGRESSCQAWFDWFEK